MRRREGRIGATPGMYDRRDALSRDIGFAMSMTMEPQGGIMALCVVSSTMR